LGKQAIVPSRPDEGWRAPKMSVNASYMLNRCLIYAFEQNASYSFFIQLQ